MELESKKLEFHLKKKKKKSNLTKMFPPHAFLLIFFQKYAFLQIFPHKDLDIPSGERSLSASSPSLRDEGLETKGPEDDFIQDLDDT